MKFIHTGDIHWGMTPDADKPWGSERAQAIKDTFKKIIAQAGKMQADCLFISGDLFHRQPLVRDLKEVNYLFTTIPNVKVILIAGNHDRIRENSALLSFSWSPNVTFFMDPDLNSVYFEDINTEIYGFSYHTREIKKPLLEDMQVSVNNHIQILMAHGGDTAHLPINFNSLELSPFSYIALGHIHRPQALMKDRIIYAGALEPIDRNDVGPHGYVKGEITEAGVHTQWIPCAMRSYIHLEVPVNTEDTMGSVRKKILEAVKDYGAENMYKIILTGYRDPDLRFDTERMDRDGNLLEVIDETAPQYDMEELLQENEGNLLGEYIRRFKDCEKDSREYQALYEGVEVLLKNKG